MGGPYQPQTLERQIEKDFTDADHAIGDYDDRIKSNATVRSRMLTEAEAIFQQFLQLKEKQTALSQYVNIFLLASSAVMPELGLAVSMGKSFAKVKEAIDKFVEFDKLEKRVEKVKGVTEKVSGWKEKQELKKDVKEAAEVKEMGNKLISYTKYMTFASDENDFLIEKDRLIAATRDTISNYYYYFLDHQDKYKAYALKQMVDNMLAGNDIVLGNSDLNQLRMKYLYEIIWRYCQNYVGLTKKIQRQVQTKVSYETEYEIDGLNNSQVDWILQTFGFYAPRGLYFGAPPIFDVPEALIKWGVKQKVSLNPVPIVSDGIPMVGKY